MDLADEVKQDIENRIIKGVREYGERLKPFNGRDALLDAYEECLDQALYLKQELTERQAIQVQAKVIVQLADVTDKEIEEYIDRYIDMGCFRNPEIARPYLLDGFQLGCKYMESKHSKLPE